MSLFSHLQNSFAQAQSHLAQAQGMTAGSAGNFTYNGAAYSGVFGQPMIVDQPQNHGGYKRVATLTLTATRAQFASPPLAKARLTRTVPALTEYLIDAVDTHDPHHYVMQLVKVG